MVITAMYQRTSSIKAAELLRQCIREEGLTEKELYVGRVAPSTWSNMLAGKEPLDLLVLLEVLTLGVWMRFGPRLLAAIVRRFCEEQKEGAA